MSDFLIRIMVCTCSIYEGNVKCVKKNSSENSYTKGRSRDLVAHLTIVIKQTVK
jgi:hypothetical protein